MIDCEKLQRFYDERVFTVQNRINSKTIELVMTPVKVKHIPVVLRVQQRYAAEQGVQANEELVSLALSTVEGEVPDWAVDTVVAEFMDYNFSGKNGRDGSWDGFVQNLELLISQGHDVKELTLYQFGELAILACERLTGKKIQRGSGADDDAFVDEFEKFIDSGI